MSENELVAYQIEELQKNYEELKSDLKDVKDLVTRIDKKLAAIPDSGLQCGIHSMKHDETYKRLEILEIKTDKINSKIITWSAVFAVVIFILSELAFPYVINNFKVSVKKPTSQVVQPNTNTAGIYVYQP